MRSLLRRRLLLSLPFASAALAGWGAAFAADFPTRPVTLIVPFPAGGATDSFVRAVADLAGRELGQPVIVDNKPGAAGVLGANQLVRSAPDGYTLSILPESVFRLPHLQKTQFDPLRDFSYVIHLSGYALGIATLSGAPWRDWASVVADAKKRPGQISYGTTGVNGTMHVTVEEMAQRAGIKLNHVPYKGESEIIQALMGGHIDLAVTAGSIAPMVETGKARVLVLWTEKRAARWPDVPTLREAGLDMVANSPFGIAGPKGMPAAVVKTLHDAFRKALEDPGTQKLLERLNQESAYLDSEAYAAFARERFEISRKQVERMGAAPAQ
ncbi:tripartite tricarboxylate transporter substrate binding protein [Variovorax saccharolyticus]|uniref:tripartite tricarboxylate transporter substrate binding protein n=1 Tax=Variovorax saccharolyticus TaxID=3053516 RepID=UPI002575D3F9|nr:tripartite tricarboxylate transporter substrate binding protein [Variovorax sp. J22R187]MDM0018463.1 tripartite tricarboxylate transporter substrate binding protein [Variovorax sp. J22R187]